ncbi:MAG: helix-turn-helix domain-containing protein [Anaerolineae bacterium]|nr:helix-turn-helix domain-containing protein [Anaerolineae bacterium]
MDKILTVQEVADYLKVSRTTVWRWCNQGKLPAFKVGRGWRIHRSRVEELIGEEIGEEDGKESENERFQAAKPESQQPVADIKLKDSC